MTPPEVLSPSRDAAAAPWRPWFALLAPPAAWVIHELASFYVASDLCRQGRTVAARTVLAEMTLVALAIAISGAIVCYRALLVITGGRPLAAQEGRQREELLVFAGLLVGVVFSLAIVWGGLPSVLLSHGCEARE